MTNPISPVEDDNGVQPQDGIGLALSGGGYRAMLFHAGAIIRLYELGLLAQVTRISSVSGGSITAAKLALEWPRVTDRAALFAHVIDPLRRMASTSIDVSSVVVGAIWPGHVGGRIAAAYANHLFGEATLQDIPDAPVFIINATNVETGTLWRFSKSRARDWRVGEIAVPEIRLADAVAASSAFPPVLSPFVLETTVADFTTVEPGVDPAFLSDISLTDGGVYDNLGLESVFKRCRTVLVSNGGGALATDPSPPSDWLRHTFRVIEIIHNQVSSLRVRQLIANYEAGQRNGCYWGIGTNIADYALSDALPAPHDRTLTIAETPTRLKRMDDPLQERIINWGYAVNDAAMRRHCPELLAGPPPAWPYPANAV